MAENDLCGWTSEKQEQMPITQGMGREWIVVDDGTIMPPANIYCFWTLENIRSGIRSVKYMRLGDLWQGQRCIAFMMFTAPTPFGGECLPIDPQDLDTRLRSGLSKTDIAKYYGYTLTDLSNLIRLSDRLSGIWYRPR